MQVTVTFDSIDVYLDGSFGADTWSLEASCQLNGEEVELEDGVLWTEQPDISDNCETGEPGPEGDENYCRYELLWSTVFELGADDELRCGIRGIAHDNEDPVDYSERVVELGEVGETVTGHVGAGNGDTEYWLNYSVAFNRAGG
jgi:hypothetical protein